MSLDAGDMPSRLTQCSVTEQNRRQAAMRRCFRGLLPTEKPGPEALAQTMMMARRRQSVTSRPAAASILARSLLGIYAGRHEQHGGKGLAALKRSETKIQHRARSGPVIVHQAIGLGHSARKRDRPLETSGQSHQRCLFLPLS